MTTPNVVTFSAAATEKDVHRSTLYRAADRGELSVVKIGTLQMLARDEAYRGWQPQEIGGRARKAAQQGDETSSEAASNQASK